MYIEYVSAWFPSTRRGSQSFYFYLPHPGLARKCYQCQTHIDRWRFEQRKLSFNGKRHDARRAQFLLHHAGKDTMKFISFLLILFMGIVSVLTACAGASQNATPAAPPTLMTPSDGSTGIPLTIGFFWLSVNQATYEFQLSSDPGYSNIVERRTNLKNNRYSLTSTLSPETVYYWRVRASVRGKAPSSWADAKFTTGPNVNAPGPLPIQGE